MSPTYPGYCKIGRTRKPVDRLRVFNTASPYRDYRYHHKRWFTDVHDAERRLTASARGFSGRGEWFLLHPDDAKKIVDDL